MTIVVGTKVEVSIDRYPAHVGKDLYVLYVETYMDKAIGYGVGPASNDPDKWHSTDGWLYYNAKHVTPAPPIKESNTLTTFTKGDRVEFVEDYDFPVKKGMQGTVVRYNGGYGADVAVDGHREVFVYTRRLKKVEAEPIFKVGDRATVKGFGTRGGYEGYTGTVVDTYGGTTSARLDFGPGAPFKWGTFNVEYLVPAPAPEEARKKGEFRVGDKIRVTKGAWTDPEWVGVEGIIEELPAVGSTVCKVKLTTSPKGKESRWPVGYIALLGNIELVEDSPKPFAYADIQVGDTIKRTRMHKSGSVEVREGTVAEQATGYFTDGKIILAYKSDALTEGVTLELLNRPDPEPVRAPEVWEDARAGSTLIVKNKAQKTTRVLTKRGTGNWDSLVIRDNARSFVGFNYTDEELAGITENREVQFIKA